MGATMKQSEYLRYDATALADLIRRGEVTSGEVCEAAVQRATSVNGSLNAICSPQFTDALTQDFPEQGVFSGVPLLLKDLAQEQAGQPCTYGSRSFKNNIASQDSEFVRRARAGGLVFLGRTATPEFGLKAITESELWGPSRNPWNTQLTPGGSSGGSGASTDHVVTRTVRDSAAMLDVLRGAAPGDPFVIPAPGSAYGDLMRKSPGNLKIGVFTSSPYNTSVAPECMAAVEETARILEGLGHKVEYARPEFDGMALARCYLGLYFGEVAAMMAKAKDQFGARDSDFELDTRLIGMLGNTMPLSDYVLRRQQWNEFARALAVFFGRYDLYLCPTTGQLPARIGELETPAHLKLAAKLMLALKAGKTLHRSGQVDQMAMESLARTPFTQFANLTGTPAMSVPMHWTAEGLPVGVQFGASHGGEDVLLQLAAELEEAAPWLGYYERLENAFPAAG